MKQRKPIVELVEIQKAFAGVPVLEKVSLDVYSGTVHGLIGGNGAGKSTLMKIMSGLYRADAGEIIVESESVVFRSPVNAHQKGIYLVPQDPTLFPDMTVEENVLLGLPKGSRKNQKEKLEELMQSLRCDFRPDHLAGELSLAKQQQIELIRGLIRETKVIILDEPTSALTAKETSALFENIKRLKSEKNIAFIYITHRLHELFEIADEVTVLRDRRIVARGPISSFELNDLLQFMVPEVEVDTQRSQENRTMHIAGNKEILKVVNFSGEGFSNINFTVRQGEILGITGVVGAGRTELAETIFGIRPSYGGHIELDGKPISVFDPRDGIRQGLAYVPENRHLHGGFLDTSLTSNISSCVLDRLSNFFLARSKEQELCAESLSSLKVKAISSEQSLRTLSGGNQQKVVLGKWLATSPKVIILDEPTRGIDANAREEIYYNIRQLANEGMGVVVISSDFEEVELLSDKAVVMFNGRVACQLLPPHINPTNLTYASFGYGEGEFSA